MHVKVARPGFSQTGPDTISLKRIRPLWFRMPFPLKVSGPFFTDETAIRSAAPLLHFHVPAQQPVDTGLIARALAAEPLEDIGV
jgi:hypothetical protein